MAKIPLQFRHNGRDVAIFVDGGTNLLVALRELIGDMTPKFGCGQGGCGTCSVLIDGEIHLSCLTLAEMVAGRSVETLDGMKQGPNLHPPSACPACNSRTARRKRCSIAIPLRAVP